MPDSTFKLGHKPGTFEETLFQDLLKGPQSLVAAEFGSKSLEACASGDTVAFKEAAGSWVEAGARLLLAPTLPATPAGLKPLGLAMRCREINQGAIEALQEVAASADSPCLVAAQMGPLPAVAAGFDQAYIQYHEQVKPLVIAGPHLVVIRQIEASRHIKAALAALREFWHGPVLVALASQAQAFPDFLALLRSFQVAAVGLERRWTGAAGDLLRRTSREAPDSPRAPRCSLLLSGGDQPAEDHPPEDGGSWLRENARGSIILMDFPARETVELIAFPAPGRGYTGAGTGAGAGAAAPADDLLRALPGAHAGFDWGRSEPGDPTVVYNALLRLEEETGRPSGMISSRPAVLEAAAKASASGAILAASEVRSDDLECAFEIAKRYGARIVLDAAGSVEGVGKEESLRNQVEYVRRKAENACLEWSSVFLDATAWLSKNEAGLATLQQLTRDLEVRWAATVTESPSGSSPAGQEPLDPAGAGDDAEARTQQCGGPGGSRSDIRDRIQEAFNRGVVELLIRKMRAEG